MVKETIVIFGSSSEVAVELQKILKEKNFDFYSLSRSEIEKNLSNHTQLDDYLEDYDKIYTLFDQLGPTYVIFFNGFLAENRDQQIPNLSEIKKTDFLNFLVPYELSNRLSTDFLNIKKFIYISSMSAIRPRYKNYIYGLSKRKLEESIKHLGLRSYLIFRFGKIKTQMSKTHKDAPFTMSAEQSAKVILNKLEKSGIVYGNTGLFIVSIIIKILPYFLFKKVKL
jgi:short-subunit dehydrogenase